jgi:hypothetical protein
MTVSSSYSLLGFPSLYSHGNNTLNQGFMKAFGSSDGLATVFSFPALYGTTALFIYGYCKQLKALSRSKLIPAAFSWTFPHSIFLILI